MENPDQRETSSTITVKEGNNVLTQSGLQVWIPIGISLIGLVAVIFSSVTAKIVDNSGRLTKLETIAEQRLALNDALYAEVNRMNIVLENHNVRLQQCQAHAAMENKQ